VCRTRYTAFRSPVPAALCVDEVPMTKGSCLCGGVRFQIDGFSRNIYKCHCSRCRKVSGAASSTATISAPGKFFWVEGERLLNTYRPKGSDHTTYFCSTCGSPVPIKIAETDTYWIPCGLLDSEPNIPFTAHICTDSMASWDILDNETEHYPDVSSFTNA